MEEQLSQRDEILKTRVLEKRIGENVSSRTPKVSVVIPAYNISEFVNVTLASVFDQTYKDYEVILVNDGSTDTAELESKIKPFSKDITYVRQKNGGASKARNTGLCLARGEIIAFLDGDDIWYPAFLESQVSYLEKNNLDMIYCNALLFGEEIFKDSTYMETAPSEGEVTVEKLINAECNVITSGTLVRKHWFEVTDLFDDELPRMQDYDMWFRLAKKGAKIGYQRDVLLKYRVRLDSLSGNNVERSERNVRGLNVIKRKYELTASEKAVLESQMVLYQAEIELEKGKFCLVSGDYEQAAIHFKEANKHYRKLKFSVIYFLLKISPGLALKIYKAARPAEFSFIDAHDS